MHLHPSLALATALAVATCAAPQRAEERRIAAVESLRAAVARGDVALARRFLASAPRIWYDERRGEGAPWTPGGGRWAAWDAHFHGHTERLGDWHVEGAAVWADFVETNDYYRLLERPARAWRGTWYFDQAGAIEGFLVAASPDQPAGAGRSAEFLDWARGRHAEELAYLMPGGSVDPTGDRPVRMRALIEEWRASVGLAPID